MEALSQLVSSVLRKLEGQGVYELHGDSATFQTTPRVAVHCHTRQAAEFGVRAASLQSIQESALTVRGSASPMSIFST